MLTVAYSSHPAVDGVRIRVGCMPVRILTGDDEKPIADTLTTILMRSRYECKTAYEMVGSASRAILTAAQSFSFSAIASNVAFPEINITIGGLGNPVGAR